MATLAQTWRTRSNEDTESLWESFLKQALSYLEFVPPGNPTAPGVYPLYEDWGFEDCIGVLYLAPPESNIDNTSVGSFYPAKLLAQLKERKLNWGILTDGASWRLYSTKSSRPYEDYVELPLEQALEGSDEAEYGLFERFFHKDSFIAEEAEGTESEQQDESVGVYKCRLDRDREQSEQVLEDNVKTPFLAQVDEVLQYICNGFIFDTQKSGEEYTEEERAEIFESAVKLIYRCLFLFYAEARRLLPSDLDKVDLYQRHSIQALCKEARKFRWGERRDTDQYDLWKHLKGLINAVNDGDPEYGIMGYNGGLFDDEEERFLGQHQLGNDFVCRALYLLAFVEPYDNEPDEEYAIPYEDLEVRHLGELYENILEYTVQLADADRIRRRTKKGVEMLLASQATKRAGDTLIKKGDVYFGESALERKQTGSYYTPESLVRFLNEKTIVQPLRETFEKEYRQRFNELLEQAGNGHDAGTRRGAAQSAAALVERFVTDAALNFKVCDPAMGSGHFLVDSANQMAGLVVALLEEVPHVEGITVSVTSRPNDWRRRITRHCIYGVDLNPLAVNLAKLSLWLNCFASEHKLTFLDHHVRCGNSLIGIRSLNQLASIPERRKESKKKKDPQRLLFDYNDLSSALAEAGQGIASITQIDEDDTDSQKAVLDEALDATSHLRPLADLFTAYLMDPDIQPGDYKDIFERLAKGMSVTNTLNSALAKIQETVEGYNVRHHFYHWPLEFPDVFGPEAVGGFTATVGNPPWDAVKPKMDEFFSSYHQGFTKYNRKKKDKISSEILRDNEAISDKWDAYCTTISEQSKYFKEGNLFEYLGSGDINTYKLFLERCYQAIIHNGHLGIVVPSALCTDKGCMPLRVLFFEKTSIDFMYCYENRNPTVFLAVHPNTKFAIFKITKGQASPSFPCAFMQHDPETLPLIHSKPLIMNVKDVRKFSPEVLGIMEFESQRDIDVTSSVYGDKTLLCDNKSDWKVKLTSEFNMTNDRGLFRSKEELSSLGSIVSEYDFWIDKKANIDSVFSEQKKRISLLRGLVSDNNTLYLPLYEGKNTFIFDTDYSSRQFLIPVTEALSKNQDKRLSSILNPKFVFRSTGQSGNERNCIGCVLPEGYFTGNSLNYSVYDSKCFQEDRLLLFCSIFTSFVIDYIIRQKIDKNLNLPFIYSLPFPDFNTTESKVHVSWRGLLARAAVTSCESELFNGLWAKVYSADWQSPDFWYPPSAPIETYGPAHEQEIRKKLRDEAKNLTPEWGPHCGVHDRLPDRRDTGDRAQMRAEIDAYVAHLYGLSRGDFAYILDTFQVLERKEKKAFGEFMSKRKCLEEYDRLSLILGEKK